MAIKNETSHFLLYYNLRGYPEKKQSLTIEIMNWQA
jgi:hypothetical protein